MLRKFSTITSALQEELLSRDVHLNSIFADGKIYRFDAPDKRRGNLAGWYVCPTPEVAVFGFWHTGEQHLVTLDGEHDPIAAARARKAAEKVKREREEMRRHEQGQTANQANTSWTSAPAADPDHPYLLKKGVQPHNLCQEGNTLLVPLYSNGRIVNLQRIYPDGKKRFMKWGMIKGAASMVGSLTGASHVYLTEGWATAATIHEASGCPVVAAMTANNLPVMACTLRRKLATQISIIIAADNDRETCGNPGLTYGRQAAESIGANICWPRFPCEECACSDFNDLANCEKSRESAI